MTTRTNAVSGQSQNCSGNLEISPGIGTRGKFPGKHAIIPGHCRKNWDIEGKYAKNSGGWSKFPGRLKLRPSSAQTAFVRVVTPRIYGSTSPPPHHRTINESIVINYCRQSVTSGLSTLFLWNLWSPIDIYCYYVETSIIFANIRKMLRKVCVAFRQFLENLW